MPVTPLGPFTFDPDSLELRRGAARVALERQPAKLLALLLARRGQVVRRDDIADHLWGAHVHVSHAEGLHYAVRRIRRALGDSADNPRFIETLPGVGYRLLPDAPAASRHPAVWRFRLAAAAAAIALVVVLETTPNRHHEQAVWLANAIHGLLF